MLLVENGIADGSLGGGEEKRIKKEVVSRCFAISLWLPQLGIIFIFAQHALAHVSHVPPVGVLRMGLGRLEFLLATQQMRFNKWCLLEGLGPKGLSLRDLSCALAE